MNSKNTKNILKHNLIINNKLMNSKNTIMENDKILSIQKNLNLSNNNMERQLKIDKLFNEFKKTYPKKKIIWNGKFTKNFIEFNKEQLVFEDTDVVGFSDNKLYNILTNKFVNKSTFLTNKNKLRKKYDNKFNTIKNDLYIDSQSYLDTITNKVRSAELNKKDITIPINFRNLNGDLTLLLSVLNPTTERYLLETEIGDTTKIFTLNSSTIERLIEFVKDGGGLVGEGISGSDEALVSAWVANKPFVLKVLSAPLTKKQQNGVGFFGYTHTLDKVDLSKYGIHTEEQEYNSNTDLYEINCVCQALDLAGCDISKIKHLVKNRVIPQKHLKKVAEILNVYITIRNIKDETNKIHYGNKKLKEIKMGNINSHAFLIEPIPYTRYCIENYEDVKDQEDFHRIINKKNHKKFDRFIDSYKAIKYLFMNKETLLKPIKYHNDLYKSVFHNNVSEFGCLDYEESVNTKENFEKKPNEDIVLDTIFYDFETTTKRDDGGEVKHTPYCCYTDKHRNGFWGADCGEKLLNNLCDKYGTDRDNKDIKLVMSGFKYVKLIAHNAGYDFRFLIKYLFNIDTIEKSNSLMNGTALVYNKNKVLSVNLRDSMKLINTPLRNFSKYFNLDVKKEILPYDLYTEEAVIKKYLNVDYCLSFVKSEEQNEYLENCKKWDCFHTLDDIKVIDIHKYAGEYCYMDCITLRDGFNTFKKLVVEATGQDINNYISLASMSHDYLVLEGCYEGVLQISGVPRHFIQKCVVGGRCMTAQNKKWIKRNSNISDFDAVSLYPSAMNRMDGYLIGKPKVIVGNFQPEIYDGYFVYIEITKINKSFNFPCASILTESGIRHFTNDLVGEKIYMDKTGLEDLIKFQGAEYKFIKGYYYNEGRNDSIKKTMKHLFEERLKFKKVKNPIQLVFKELMNSSYGKSFMKPIDSDKQYIPRYSYNKETKQKEETGLKEFIDKHYNNIKEITLMFDEKTYKIETIKPIDDHFNNVPVGVEILSMSKRIMFEVMTLAEDNEYNMYITDTDSIHIDTDKVEPLGELFKQKYGRNLIGSGMGEFHTDFDLNKSVGEIIATDSVFLGKKCYCDRLQSKDKDGKIINGFHTRMKGIPDDSIITKAENDFGGDIIKLYTELYENENGLEFDLLANKPKFEFHKNMTISSKKQFLRKVKFNYIEGNKMY